MPLFSLSYTPFRRFDAIFDSSLMFSFHHFHYAMPSCQLFSLFDADYFLPIFADCRFIRQFFDISADTLIRFSRCFSFSYIAADLR